MNNVIKFTVNTTDASASLGFCVTLDGVEVARHNHVVEATVVELTVPESEGEHQLVFEMFGKLPNHTRVDDQGQITQDALLTISNFEVLDFNIDKQFYELFKYNHNYNGNGPNILEDFNGSLGCNGHVVFEFITPLYLWILEKLT